MDEKMIRIQLALLISFSFVNLYSYSQSIYTESLKWETVDSSSARTFNSDQKILEWLKEEYDDVSIPEYRLFILDNSEYFIFWIDVCSGIYCPGIYLFERKSGYWQLIASSEAKLVDKLEVKVDQNLNKIIFRTKKSQIGEFPNP